MLNFESTCKSRNTVGWRSVHGIWAQFCFQLIKQMPLFDCNASCSGILLQLCLTLGPLCLVLIMFTISIPVSPEFENKYPQKLPLTFLFSRKRENIENLWTFLRPLDRHSTLEGAEQLMLVIATTLDQDYSWEPDSCATGRKGSPSLGTQDSGSS